MPCSIGRHALHGLLEHPEHWTAADRQLVEYTLAQQRELLAVCHPDDGQRAAALAQFVTELEAALSTC